MPSVAIERIRASKIRMIQVAKRQLAIEDADYRAAIGRAVKGKSSCSDCTTLQLDRVIDELKRLGFRPRKPANAKPKPERRPLDTSAEASKARALWLLLAELGAVRDPSEAALNTYVLRQTGVDDMHWVPDMTPVIEGLKAWAARLLPAALQARLDALKAAKLLVPGDTVAAVIQRAAPNRRPDSFDALWAAWERLAIIASAAEGASQ